MKILDPACGSKMFWFNKHESHTTYTDIRSETLEAKDRDYIRKIEIKPDESEASLPGLLGDEELKEKGLKHESMGD